MVIFSGLKPLHWDKPSGGGFITRSGVINQRMMVSVRSGPTDMMVTGALRVFSMKST